MAQPSSNISQKQTDNVSVRLKQLRPQGQFGPNEIAIVVSGCPQVLDSGFSL